MSRHIIGRKTAFLIAAGALLSSIFLPFLFIIFSSPQYPDRSPKMYLYTNGLKGDLHDWKVVGRYIGVNVEPDLPEFDFNIVPIIIVTLALLLLFSAFSGDRLKKATSILLLTVGIAFAGWAQYRLYEQGHNLDPTAPMRFVVKPFTPPLIGVTKVSKIRIYHLPHLGSLLFALSCGLTLYAAWWRRSR